MRPQFHYLAPRTLPPTCLTQKHSSLFNTTGCFSICILSSRMQFILRTSNLVLASKKHSFPWSKPYPPRIIFSCEEFQHPHLVRPSPHEADFHRLTVNYLIHMPVPNFFHPTRHQSSAVSKSSAKCHTTGSRDVSACPG